MADMKRELEKCRRETLLIRIQCERERVEAKLKAIARAEEIVNNNPDIMELLDLVSMI